MATFKINGKNFATQSGTGEATVHSDVVFPTGHIISVQSSEVTEGSMTMPGSGNNMDTVFGTHSHTFKSANSKILVMWQGSIGMYSSASQELLYTLCQIRTSIDSYASALTEQNIEILMVARTDLLIQYPGIFSTIHTPSHSANDSHTYKMYSGGDSGGSNIIRSNRRNSGPMYWYTYEIAL